MVQVGLARKSGSEVPERESSGKFERKRESEM